MKNRENFSLVDLQKEYELIGKKSEFILPSGKTIVYDKYFSQSDISNLVNEFKEDFLYVKNNNLELLNSTEEIIKYQGYLIIKNFTHLKNEIDGDFHKKIAIYNKLIEIDLYNTILEEVLPEEQVKKAIDGLMSYLINVSKIAEGNLDLSSVKIDGI